jgi:hypothetical protein
LVLVPRVKRKGAEKTEEKEIKKSKESERGIKREGKGNWEPRKAIKKKGLQKCETFLNVR